LLEVDDILEKLTISVPKLMISFNLRAWTGFIDGEAGRMTGLLFDSIKKGVVPSWGQLLLLLVD
jgi:hypothetical protein